MYWPSSGYWIWPFFHFWMCRHIYFSISLSIFSGVLLVSNSYSLAVLLEVMHRSNMILPMSKGGGVRWVRWEIFVCSCFFRVLLFTSDGFLIEASSDIHDISQGLSERASKYLDFRDIIHQWIIVVRTSLVHIEVETVGCKCSLVDRLSFQSQWSLIYISHIGCGIETISCDGWAIRLTYISRESSRRIGTLGYLRKLIGCSLWRDFTFESFCGLSFFRDDDIESSESEWTFWWTLTVVIRHFLTFQIRRLYHFEDFLVFFENTLDRCCFSSTECICGSSDNADIDTKYSPAASFRMKKIRCTREWSTGSTCSSLYFTHGILCISASCRDSSISLQCISELMHKPVIHDRVDGDTRIIRRTEFPDNSRDFGSLDTSSVADRGGLTTAWSFWCSWRIRSLRDEWKRYNSEKKTLTQSFWWRVFDSLIFQRLREKDCIDLIDISDDIVVRIRRVSIGIESDWGYFLESIDFSSFLFHYTRISFLKADDESLIGIDCESFSFEFFWFSECFSEFCIAYCSIIEYFLISREFFYIFYSWTSCSEFSECFHLLEFESYSSIDQCIAPIVDHRIEIESKSLSYIARIIGCIRKKWHTDAEREKYGEPLFLHRSIVSKRERNCKNLKKEKYWI